MVERIIKAAEYPNPGPGNALQQMIDLMDWNIEVTEADLNNLNEYITVMKPFKTLIERLGGEKKSTIHLVYPTIKQLELHLNEMMRNKVQTTFCQALKKNFDAYFKFVLDRDHIDFEPFYIVATYLDAFHKKSLDEEMTSDAKTYLKDLIKEEMYRGCDKVVSTEKEVLVVVVETEHNETESDGEEEIDCLLPGFTKNILSQTIEETSSSRIDEEDVLIDRDIDKFEKISEEEMLKAIKMAKEEATIKREKLKKEGKSDEAKKISVEIKVEDPLDWWLRMERKEYWQSILPALAQDILVVPATSVPSERTYSVTGILSKGKFSSVKSDTPEKRMIIACNPNLD